MASYFVLVPIIGYTGLWILGILFFLLYFRIFHIPINLTDTVAMIRKVPPILSIVTVPVCSFVSFFLSTKLMSKATPMALASAQFVEIGAISLFVTIVLDLLITVLGEKIDIRIYPVNLMYFLAWLVIIPAVILGGI